MFYIPSIAAITYEKWLIYKYYMLLSHTIITYTIILPSPEATPLQYFWSSSLKYFNAKKKKTKNQKIFF